MIPLTIAKEIEIAASAVCVWQYLGSEAGLRQWWGTEITLEAKPGGRCEERSVYQGSVCYLRGQVTVYDPPHQLALLLRNEERADGRPAWMTISLTLHEAQDRTRVVLVHQAFDLVSEQDAIGQRIPVLPSSTVAPQAIWRRSQPQNALGAGAIPVVDWPQVAYQPTVTLDRSWLAQSEFQWGVRLQALANQVPPRDQGM